MVTRRTWLKSAMLTSAALAFGGAQALPQYPDDFPTQSSDTKQTIRICFNENPYGPPPKARQAIINSIALGNRYPDDLIQQLKEKIAEREFLTPDHIFISAGSTEVLELTGLIYSLEPGEIVSCGPTFDILMTYAGLFDVKWNKLPLTEDMQFDLNAIRNRLSTNTSLVYICNPNNPTGARIHPKMLTDFCASVTATFTNFY